MEIIKGKTAGFCYGVKRAVDGAYETINNETNVYCLGELVHNGIVIKHLEDQNVKIIDDINLAEDNSSVIIRAHGVTKDVYEIAKKKDLKIFDYSCPNVLRIHDIAYEYANKGYYIFCVGSKDHPEIIGTLSYCGDHVSSIEDEEDITSAIEDFKKSGIKDLLIIVQTTFNHHSFDNICNIIKDNLKDINIVIKNTICNATNMRQKETEKLSKEVEKMIIIGGKKSSNTKKLYEIAKEVCDDTYLIEDASVLNIDDFKETNKLGIMAGASTPDESIEKVISLLNNI